LIKIQEELISLSEEIIMVQMDKHCLNHQQQTTIMELYSKIKGMLMIQETLGKMEAKLL
jgi:hypothetical protein